MDLSLRVLVSPAKAIAWTTAAAAIAVICLVSNFTITGAQQPLQTSQSSSSMPQSPTLLNSKDSFRVKLPAGWVIQDINNTGFTLAAEVLQGYGLLAQLCPQQEREQSISSNYNSSMSNRYIGSCQHAGDEVIHIIRYPNLGARLGIPSGEDVFTIIENWGTVPNAILAYHLQKLQEAGYRDFKIVNSIDTTINVDNSTDISNRRMATTTTIPAKLVEMTYSTSLPPDRIRTGYFILTATAATPRNLGIMTGYSVFYEGNSTAVTTGAENTTTAISPDSILASPTSTPTTSLPPPVIQIFDSFELVATSSTEPLTVEITSEETEGIAPATFEFEAEVAGGMEPYTIRWDFGEGGIISSEEEQEENDEEEVEHTFEIASMYNVRVLVTDSTGRTAIDSILVTVDEPPPLTSVEITSNNTTGDAPATFEFEAEVIGGIEPYSYRWNFGDGSTATDDDEDIVHIFDTAGTYNVSLVVIDSTGRTAIDSMVITVQVSLLSPSPPLTATSIISNGTEGIAPATFEFEAEISGGLEPYIIRWDFGDGSSSDDESNMQTVLHTFDQSGRYDVGVIVIDSRNQIAFDSIAITVEEEEQEPPATEEGPNLDDLDNNSGSDDLFDLDDLLDSLELPNNVVNIGGTSAARDYDATADD